MGILQLIPTGSYKCLAGQIFQSLASNQVQFSSTTSATPEIDSQFDSYRMAESACFHSSLFCFTKRTILLPEQFGAGTMAVLLCQISLLISIV